MRRSPEWQSPLTNYAQKPRADHSATIVLIWNARATSNSAGAVSGSAVCTNGSQNQYPLQTINSGLLLGNSASGTTGAYLYCHVFTFCPGATDGMPYALFAFSALLPWTFFSNGMSGATIGLVSHSHLLLKVYFPREILPLSYVFAALADFLTASGVFALLMLYYGVSVTINVLWAIPAILTLTMFLTGLTLLTSAFQVRFRDVGVALPLVLQVWMFATPVVYSLASVPAKLRFWYDFNPMVGIVETLWRCSAWRLGELDPSRRLFRDLANPCYRRLHLV